MSHKFSKEQKQASVVLVRYCLGFMVVDNQPERGSLLTTFFQSLKSLNHSKSHFVLTASSTVHFQCHFICLCHRFAQFEVHALLHFAVQ